MRRLPVIYFLVVLFIPIPLAAQSREEFNGAFESWANVRTRFGAGRTGDDTRALQRAIDSLSVFQAPEFNIVGATKYLVIYLPAGVYHISSTLHLTGKIGCSIIGEDPDRTIVQWTGGDQDTMLSANGSSYFKISRLTWNAGVHAGVEAIGLHWVDNNGPRFASTSIEFSDMVFLNTRYGISGGTFGGEGTGANDAEVAIKRCRFIHCSEAGIYIKGYNALDYWIWDCLFKDCNRGVQCSLGNYHAYHSAFFNSATADFDNSGPYYCSVRNCYSANANDFSVERGSSSNPFKRIFENNIVELIRDIPIQYYDQGRLTLMGNVFSNSKSTHPFTVNYGGWYNAIYQVLSINNFFEDSIYVNPRPDHPFVLYSTGDVRGFKKRPRIIGPPPIVPFIAFRKRTMYEINEGMSTADIQGIVNRASSGNRSVIHFGAGIYYFDQAIHIPPNSDIQIVGDGLFAATIFRRRKADQPFSFFEVMGKSQSVFRDFSFQSQNINDVAAILFSGFDVPRSEIHMDQIYSDAKTTFLGQNIDETYFEKDNSFHSTGNTLIGGKKSLIGRGHGGLYCFGGQSAKVLLGNNAVMVVKDCWWEGVKKKEYLPIDLTGSGRFTLQGALLAPGDIDSAATLRISQFKGNVTFSDLYIWGGMDVKSSPDTKILVWNTHFMMKQLPSSFINPQDKYMIGMAGISSACARTQSVTCTDDRIMSPPDIFKNIKDTSSFLKEMTADMRSAIPRTFRDLPSNTTNILISRVSVSGGDIAFEFKQD